MIGQGWLYGDVALCFLSFFAMGAAYFASTDHRKSRLKRSTEIMIGVGWTLFFLRLFSLITAGDDPLISPISLVALSIIAGASILRELADAFDRHICYGRRKEDRLLT